MSHLRTLQLTFIFASFAYGQGNQAWRTTFSVDVSATPDDLKGKVSSYIGHELRDLTDVTVVSENANYRLSIVASEIRSRDGEATGYVLSAVLTNAEMVPAAIEFTDSPPTKEILRLLQNHVIVLAHSVRIFSPAELRDMCSEIITEIDSVHLERARTEYRKILLQIQQAREKHQTRPTKK